MSSLLSWKTLLRSGLVGDVVAAVGRRVEVAAAGVGDVGGVGFAVR